MIDIEKLPTGRLAPSPTGALHLGNARSFLCVWLSARSGQGKVILRVEDIDSPRVKAWAREATLKDLQWLGLDWDYGPDVGGPDAPYVQTARALIYRPVLERLIAAEQVYPCDCSRSEIAASASAPHEALEGPIYPGTCRHRSSGEAARLAPDSFAWRFRASSAMRGWEDRLSGPHRANVAAQLGDFIIAKGDGTPAYQLAVVIDDHLMGVTEVVRGDDLIPSTFRQLDLLGALGWPPPAYLHLPLMIGSDGRRLAKRHGDTRLSWFREQGYAAEQIVGYLAWTAGLLPRPERIAPRELLPLWEPHKLSRLPTVVGLGELLRILDGL
ncbi:MAG: tRNA glutamyl-Q(34) synthetase GluQRS [Aureliella sp.]